MDNLKPEEAQKYLAAHDLTLKYAPKIGEDPLPATRSHNGDFIYRGRKISNPSDYVEDTYLANQFHGQDGLGRALFGYSDWNQGRVEAINGNGHVRGTYKYVDPYGKDFVANYWSDGLGFHHEDNRPKVVLEPVTDTPAVQHARAEHFRKWHEAAEQARASPDPNSDYYNRDANRYDEDQDKIDQALEIIGSTSNQHQALTRYPNLSNQKPIVPDRDYNPASSQDSVTISRDDGKYNRKYDAEPTGPPHGFYYNFDYPVYLLRRAKGGNGDQYEYGGDYGYDSSQFKSQYNSQQGQQQGQFANQGVASQFKQGQFGSQGLGGQGQFGAQGQFGQGQGQFGSQSQYSQFSSQGVKKFDNFFDNNHAHYKRTVEEQVASPALKASADLTEARVDAVHDAQVHPKQRAALDAEKVEGQ